MTAYSARGIVSEAMSRPQSIHFSPQGQLVTCPACNAPWATCPCGGDLYKQRIDEARVKDALEARSHACPRGHETAVRKRGASFFCGLCGVMW